MFGKRDGAVPNFIASETFADIDHDRNSNRLRPTTSFTVGFEDFVEAPSLIVFAPGAAVAAVLTLFLVLPTLLFASSVVGLVTVVAPFVVVEHLLTTFTVLALSLLAPILPPAYGGKSKQRENASPIHAGKALTSDDPGRVVELGR